MLNNLDLPKTFQSRALHKDGPKSKLKTQFNWLTFSVALYYIPTKGHLVLGNSYPGNVIVDAGFKNIKCLWNEFPGCTVVLYYGKGVPKAFLHQLIDLSSTHRLVLVFVKSADPRAPMIGRVAELDMRRSEWTVLMDINDDLNNMPRTVHYIKNKLEVGMQSCMPSVRYSCWPNDKRKIDACGFMVHRSAPQAPSILSVKSICQTKFGRGVFYATNSRQHRMSDDEIVLRKWVEQLPRHFYLNNLPRIPEFDLNMTGALILEKHPSKVPEDYADEIFSV